MLWKQDPNATTGAFNSVNGSKLQYTDSMKMKKDTNEQLLSKGTVLYPFQGSQLAAEGKIQNSGNSTHFLDLELGEIVYITKEVTPGWSYGVKKSTKEAGLFPAAYVVHVNHEGQEFLDKIAEVCREWGEMWKKLYVDVHSYQFEVIRRGIDDLMEGRRQILNQSLTQDQYREVARKICSKIDWGNRKLGLDLVPWAWLLPEGEEDAEDEVMRQDSLLRPDNSSIEINTSVQIGSGRLFKLHTRSVENAEMARGSNTVTRPKNKREQHNNLCISLRDFSYGMTDDCEIILSLYDGHRFISERHIISHTQLAQSSFHMNEDRPMVFQQVPTRKDLFLVVHIVRIGRMFYTENSTKKLAKSRFRRPYACGVLKLTDIDHLTDEESTCSLREQMIKIYTSDEKDYWQIHEMIISNNFKNAISSKISMVSCLFSVAVFWCGSNNTTVTATGHLVNLIDSSSLIVPPGLVRNDVYITLLTVDLVEKKQNKTGGTKNCNVECEVQVIDEEDDLLDLPGNCYKSLIFYHQNSPKFMETIKFNISIESFPKSRLRILFRHCSAKEKAEKKLFGITWLSVMDTSGTTLNNGDHTIHIFKWTDENSMPKQLTNSSLSKDTVTINSLIISTKFTQNIDLVNLLKWKQTENLKPSLQNLIQSMEATEEIVRKFLPDVLDALFTVFSDEEGNSTENSGDVFTLLVNIFQLLRTPHYTSFKSVLNTYCEGHFAAALVYKGLLQSLRHYTNVFLLQEGVTDEINETIKNCYLSLEYIFKFIVQSQGLFARATGGHLEDSFRRDVQTLISAFCKVFSMSNSSATCVSTQSVLLQNLHSIYEELLRVMGVSDVCELICEMFDSIPLQDTAGHPLSPAKLQAIHRVVKCSLFKNSLCRTKLLPVICKHIRHHLQHREELKLCTEVLNDILIYLHGIRNRNKEEAREAHADVEVVCTTTLEMLVQAVLVLERTSSVVGNLVTCLVGLLEQMDSFHYNRLWDEFHERKPLRDLLLRIFLLFRDLIKQDVFPSDWAVMKLLTNHVMLITLQQICQPLITYFINMFDVQLWTHYFNLAVTFISQPCLQLESFRSSKREMILEKYGDMRLEMGQQMLQMWAQLSDSEKRNFIPSLIGPFLEVTMIPEQRLRSQTLSVFFYDMMKAEYRLNGNFKETESELIDKLDSLINSQDGKGWSFGCEDYRAQFREIHLTRLSTENNKSATSSCAAAAGELKVDNVWSSMCAKAVESFSHLLQLLLDYRHIANLGSLDENRDKLMQCTVNLLKYYKEENRTDQYFRYVYKLHDLHLSAQNYTEAGFTLLLHGDHLNWDWERVLCETWDGVQYSRQREAERKEFIYLQVLAYFDQGKMWEKGIKLCKELANEYERRYDYTKLSKILQMQASFYDNILVQHRPEPEYFRVGFFGKEFPPFVRNKEFIYRGLEYERLATFISRIVAEWPHAELLQKNSPPDASILSGSKQHIQICSVKPIPQCIKNFLSSAPEKIRTFYRVNDVSLFQFDRRIQKLNQDASPGDDNNEFKYMWVERATMKTDSELPSILRWLEIVQKEIDELSPIEFACEKMEEANTQLQTLIAAYKNDEQCQPEVRSINPLSMKLQGMLDAAVQGGIPKYTDAFFNEEFLKKDESSHFVARLVSLLSEQVTILQQGLEIHGRFVPPGVQPLHKRLLECHADMKSKVQKTEADIAQFFAAHHAQNQNNPLRRSESGSNLLIRDSFRRAGGKSIVNSPLPPVPKVCNGKLDSGKSASNRSSVCSNEYGQLRPHYLGEDEYDDVYSQPVEDTSNKPPSIPTRLRKRGHSTDGAGGGGGGSVSSNEYIVMPPSRLREIVDGQNNVVSTNAPPKPPPKPLSTSWSATSGGTTSPPPILPRKGQLQHGEGGAMLGSKTPSTTSLASVGGGGGGTGGDPPDSPSKRLSTPPPIPPKPKQSSNKHLNHGTYLNKAELMMAMENEDRVNENSGGGGEDYPSLSEESVAAGEACRSPSRNSQENGTLNKGHPQRRSHQKEYYTLPGKETNKENTS
ncbi:unnamed protein product [Orchesella dallaii]|uniref:Dedicator of cytokinesis protein 1 n=1 Tax=Orchesella dallaii TaxID=48710 RepID=A0ABP1PR27_9HEXA